MPPRKRAPRWSVEEEEDREVAAAAAEPAADAPASMETDAAAVPAVGTEDPAGGDAKRARTGADGAQAGAEGGARRRGLFSPTLHEIESDPLTALARAHWPLPTKAGSRGAPRAPAFDKAVVARIIDDELRPTGFAFQRLMLLEFSQYLERSASPPCRLSYTHTHTRTQPRTPTHAHAQEGLAVVKPALTRVGCGGGWQVSVAAL
jgi:hypothetical protein